MKTIFFGFLSLFVVLFFTRCEAQNRSDMFKNKAAAKDNPVAFSTVTQTDSVAVSAKKIDEILADSLLKSLSSADTIEAYHLKEWSKDSTSIYKQTVLAKKLVMTKTEKDSLFKIVRNPNHYGKVPTWKKCEFSPNLAFRFVRKGKGVFYMLVALNCDVIRFAKNLENQEEGMDIDIAHKDFVKLGKKLFPQEVYFEQR